MKEHYVSFEQSVKLKEYGFDEPCENVYSQRLPNHEPFSKRDDAVRYFQLTGNSLFTETLYPAPRLDQAATWIRDCKGIDIEVTTVLRNPTKKSKLYMSNISYFSMDIDGNDCDNYVRAGIDKHSYEKVLELGISKALELLGKEEKE